MSLAKELRDWVIAGALPGYQPAAMWRDDQTPYKARNNRILLTRQNGRNVDAFVRQVDIDFLLFSPVNADASDFQTTEADAITALQYVKANFRTTADTLMTITQDVTGPFHTGQGRIYYRFSLLTFSE